MTNKAEFERLLDVYGFRCERFGQDLSTHARAQVVSAFAALASAPVAETYVEARECAACGHVGINDSSDTLAACKNCDWSGDSPKEDHCPGCAQHGTMTAACPKCGSQYSLLADRTITAALASAPVAGEAQAEQFIQAAIDQAPEPLRRLGEYLSRVLDEDQWATAERMLLGACNAAPQASEADPLSQYGYQALFNAIGKAVKTVRADKHPHIEISVEAFRAALSAQPGAKK